MRELTDAEKDFIEEKKNSSRNRNLQVTRKQHKLRKRRKYIHPLLRPSNWVLALNIVPIGLILIVTLLYVRLVGLIGDRDLLNQLSTNGIPSEYNELIAMVGLQWLPQMIDLYDNRFYIYGALFSVVVIITAIGLALKVVEKKRWKGDEEENDE